MLNLKTLSLFVATISLHLAFLPDSLATQESEHIKAMPQQVQSSLEEAIRSGLGLSPDRRFRLLFFDRIALQRDGFSFDELLSSISSCEKAVPTSGKSGSTFISTKDERFYFKSIRRIEANYFWKIIHRYFQYLEDQPHSFLVSMYALFTLDPPNGPNFILMPNLAFLPKLTEEQKADITIYDVKGRKRRFPYTVESTEIVTDDQLPDLPPLEFNLATRRQLLKDLGFLSEVGLMDYSLFILRQREAIRSVNIIDYLSQFSLKKRIKGRLLHLIWDEDQICSIPPAAYADRMKRLIYRAP